MKNLVHIYSLFCMHEYFRLYRERVTQIESKLAEVRAGRAPEYLQPLEELQINMKNRMEVSTVLRELRLNNINCKFEAEQLATQQNFQVNKPKFLLEEGELKILASGFHEYFHVIYQRKYFPE